MSSNSRVVVETMICGYFVERENTLRNNVPLFVLNRLLLALDRVAFNG
jgi:hypothetical protein